MIFFNPQVLRRIVRQVAPNGSVVVLPGTAIAALRLPRRVTEKRP